MDKPKINLENWRLLVRRIRAGKNALLLECTRFELNCSAKRKGSCMECPFYEIEITDEYNLGTFCSHPDHPLNSKSHEDLITMTVLEDL